VPKVSAFKLIFPLSINKNPRKISFFLLIGGFIFFYIWVIFSATQARLPDQDHPIKFYSNQTRHDIKLLFLQALKKANKSIFLSIYGITDPEILAVISKKSFNNLPIRLEYDPSASAPLKKLLPSSIHLHPIKTSGLMHRKIALIDGAQVFLGSANFTPTSLHHHANLVIGIYHPELATFLEYPTATSYFFKVEQQCGELYLFPDPNKHGLSRILGLINEAKRKIMIAMFTLTHPEIGEALAHAKRRGVDISIAVDAYTARGASKKMITSLEKEGIKFFLSQGKELLHHKWAMIDEDILIMGSANWTKAAFNKNHDFLFFLSPLEERQIHFLNQLWDIIETESIENESRFTN
jgi:cardiolipin synthase A/B